MNSIKIEMELRVLTANLTRAANRIPIKIVEKFIKWHNKNNNHNQMGHFYWRQRPFMQREGIRNEFMFSRRMQ